MFGTVYDVRSESEVLQLTSEIAQSFCFIRYLSVTQHICLRPYVESRILHLYVSFNIIIRHHVLTGKVMYETVYLILQN